jgi:membrane-associated phospholipid phosphatase
MRLNASVLVFAAALGVAVVYIIFVGSARGRSLDQSLLVHASMGRRESVADVLVEALNLVTAPLAAIVIVLTALRVRGPAAALATVVLIGGTALTAEGLKALLGALDPFNGESKRELGPHFYPSGHAALTMSLCLAAILAAPPSWRRMVTVGAAVAAAILGSAIFISGSHYPSDVLGGFLVALGWAAACWRLSAPSWGSRREFVQEESA